MLSFKMTNTFTNKEVELDLVNPQWTIFTAIQYLNQASNNNKQDKLRRIWDSIYTICYREIKEDELDSLDRTIPIHKATIRTSSSSSGSNEIEEILNGDHSLLDQNHKNINDVLLLLKLLYLQAIELNEQTALKMLDLENPNGDLESEANFNLLREEFISKKITNKLMQSIQDPIVLCASKPEWCDNLMYNYPMVFPFEIRHVYFQSSAFGTSRSIVWLQNQRDLILERTHNGPSPRRTEDSNEFRLGRLLHERVKVPRNNLLNYAIEVLRVTSRKKSILEIEFKEEEGTGLGPTLEFYALVAAELQRKDLKMWLCDDTFILNSNYDNLLNTTASIIDQQQNPDYYVNHSSGLFPAPLDQNHKNINEICALFEFLGAYIAKAFQDNRLVDLPLSLLFLKLFSHNSSLAAQNNATAAAAANLKLTLNDHHSSEKSSSCTLNTLIDKLKSLPISDEEELIKSRSLIQKEAQRKIDQYNQKDNSWLKGILNEFDFQQLYPNQGKFLNQLKELSHSKQKILLNSSLSLDEKQNQINNLNLPNADNQIRLEDLGLTFQFLPTSRVYEFDAVNLKANGELEEVNMSNFEEYYELLLDFCLHSGIKKQLNAFKLGFNKVFSN